MNDSSASVQRRRACSLRSSCDKASSGTGISIDENEPVTPCLLRSCLEHCKKITFHPNTALCRRFNNFQRNVFPARFSLCPDFEPITFLHCPPLPFSVAGPDQIIAGETVARCTQHGCQDDHHAKQSCYHRRIESDRRRGDKRKRKSETTPTSRSRLDNSTDRHSDWCVRCLTRKRSATALEGASRSKLNVRN